MKERDIAKHFLTMLLNVLGIENVKVVTGEVANVMDMGKKSMSGFVSQFEADIQVAAGREEMEKCAH